MKNPEMIRQLHIDVKNGMFDTIAPRANKLKVYDGGSKSDLDYYKMAAKQYFEEQADAEARQQAQEVAAQEAAERKAEQDRLAKVKADQERRKATKQASKKRKAAAPTRKAAGTKKAVDYLDDSDEAFEEWYRKLEDS
jgi:membrane protein involved in colicin uptake